MKSPVTRLSVAAAALIFLSSCVTVNRLDEFTLSGSSMAPRIYTPPFAEVNLQRGTIPGSENSTLLAIVEIGANVAVGVQEQKLEERLNSILRGEDLEVALETEFVPETAVTLDAMTISSTSRADYLLDVEVREYGIYTSGGVYLNISLEARIIHNASGEIVWRRRLSVDEAASPSLFGINEYVGTAINVATLDAMSDEELRDGFRRLSERAAFNLSERFRRDYYKALRG